MQARASENFDHPCGSCSHQRYAVVWLRLLNNGMALSRTGACAALDQLAIFRCELLHVSHLLDEISSRDAALANIDRRTRLISTSLRIPLVIPHRPAQLQ